MPYKDREKQREAVRKSVQKLRGKQKGITQISNTPKPETIPPEIKESFSELVKRLEILTSEIKNLREENLFFRYEISEFSKTLPKISSPRNGMKAKSRKKRRNSFSSESQEKLKSLTAGMAKYSKE